MQSIRLWLRPPMQKFVGGVGLALNYGVLPGVEIELENPERVPNEPVLFAMNHTDFYNFWPLQYMWWTRHDRFAATWVKGKNYESRFSSKFLEWTNNIPVPSRGYIITRDFTSTIGRRPSEIEYRAARDAIDGVSEDISALPEKLLTTKRSLLGRTFDPSKESYVDASRATFTEMMNEFIRLNRKALDLGLDLLVFPQGTRSVRLSRGQIGLAQMALTLKCPVVPIGSNGSDRVYTSKSPWGERGRIVYRFGEPITVDEIQAFDPGPFTPFSNDLSGDQMNAFQGLTDLVMERIDALLDARHQFTDDKESEGVEGTKRFL